MPKRSLYVVIVLTTVLFALSGCFAEPIKPGRNVTAKWKRIEIIPLESPPLETSPDFTLLQRPVMVGDTVSMEGSWERGAFEGPGNIALFGVLPPDQHLPYQHADKETVSQPGALEIAPRSEPGDKWNPTLMLADQLQRLLATRGIDATLCTCVGKLPLTNKHAWSNCLAGTQQCESGTGKTATICTIRLHRYPPVLMAFCS